MKTHSVSKGKVTLRQIAEMSGVSAVSYTHLDVYKRQPQDRRDKKCQKQ